MPRVAGGRGQGGRVVAGPFPYPGRAISGRAGPHAAGRGQDAAPDVLPALETEVGIVLDGIDFTPAMIEYIVEQDGLRVLSLFRRLHTSAIDMIFTGMAQAGIPCTVIQQCLLKDLHH
jgi:hypothetical protein